MERLTEDYGKAFEPFRYALKDKSDVEPGYFKNYDAFYSHMMLVQHLGRIEDMWDKGLLVELPCKVGDTVYWIDKCRKEIKPLKVLNMTIASCGIKEISFCTASYTPAFATKEKFGTEIFFTLSEAEEALAKRGE